MKKIFMLFFTIGFLILSMKLDSTERVPGDLIIMLNEGTSEYLINDFTSSYSDYELKKERTLSPRFSIFLFSYNDNLINDEEFLKIIKSDKRVRLAQFNHTVEKRELIPNDIRFNEQWALKNTGQNNGTPGADIKATFAWSYTENITNVNTREIVVAVIDDGFALNHPDINWWKNENEIQGNGLDDDGNGYVDDYHGWNAYNNTGLLPVMAHGTHVSGIIGAHGNNGIGVSGVLWDIKVMPIAGSSSNEAIVVAAYNYALENRIIYNESNGQNGAYVVATNSSFGINYGNPVNYPIWGEMYNLMGQAGILSAAATMNINANVDQVGDVPTAFDSPYLISVTNTTNLDTKNSNAAFGAQTIDLGAPGTTILSTVSNNLGYGNMTGTSMATPHVAGVIGLMYKAASERLLSDYDDNPEELALLFKDFLLAGVDPIPALNGITVTGGRLNALNPVLSVIAMNPNPNLFFSEFINGTEYNKAIEIFNPYNESIDLQGYEVRLAVAGSNWEYTQLLTGTLASNDVYVIYNPQANAEIQNVGNISSIVAEFTENDVLGLFYQNQLIDTFGEYLINPVNGWSVAGISGASANHTLVRKNTVSRGNPDWCSQSGTNVINSEWIVYPVDTFSFLGNHEFLGENIQHVATPVANITESVNFNPFYLTFSCETEGAIIYYTLDGTIPNPSSFQYTEAIEISSHTTVKAIAYAANYAPSDIAEYNYYFAEPVSSLEELRTQACDETIYYIDTEVIVTFKDSNRNKIYAQDQTAGIRIDYSNCQIPLSLNAGDGLTGLAGRLEENHNMLTLVLIINISETSSTENIIEPVLVTFQELSDFYELYESRLVKVRDSKFNSTGTFEYDNNLSINDETSGYFFNAHFSCADYINSVIPVYHFDLTGLVLRRSAYSFITARSIHDIEQSFYLPPENLTVSTLNNNVILNWTEPGQNRTTISRENYFENYAKNISLRDNIPEILGYNIFRNGTLITENPFNATSYIDSSLVSGYYTYIVRTVYEERSSIPVTANILVGDSAVTSFPWIQGFEENTFPPSGWHLLDNDNDGYTWFHFTQPGAGWWSQKCVASASWYGVALTPDNWLITPAIQLPSTSQGNAMRLNFYVSSQDPMFINEHYSVLISTTNIEPGSFYTIYEETLDENNHTWRARDIRLDGYEGQIVYIAFRHHNVTNMFYIKLDRVMVYQGSNTADLAISPVTTQLFNNYPNPFNPETNIKFSLKDKEKVEIVVFNTKGQKVKTLVNDILNQGEHNIIWNGTDETGTKVGSGIYFYRMKSGSYTSTKKMILLK